MIGYFAQEDFGSILVQLLINTWNGASLTEVLGFTQLTRKEQVVPDSLESIC